MKRIWLILAAVMLLFTGCGKKAEDPALDPAASLSEGPAETPLGPRTPETPREGGTLELSMGMVQTLNPLLNADVSVDRVLHLMFEPLVKIDGTQKVTPNIAQSWYLDETGTVATLVLNTGLRWHDGTPITADDVIYSLDTIAASAENSVYRHCLDRIASYEKNSEASVSITFTENFSGNLYYLEFPVISKAYYGGANATESTRNLQPMGSGPYAFSAFRQGKELRLAKTANSFTETPYIDEIVVTLTKDSDAELYAFDQGITDAIVSDRMDLGQYENQKAVLFYPFTTNEYECMGFNFRNSTLQDKNIRQALAYAMPKEALVESVYLTHGTAADTPVNPASWLSADAAESYAYDPAKARELLEASGWVDDNGDGFREKTINAFSDRLEFTLLINQESPERLQTASRLKAEYQSVGISLVIDSQPYAAYLEKLESGNFDLFLAGWSMSAVPDLTFLLHSTSPQNYTGYHSEGMDTLLMRANTAKTEEAVLEAYETLQKQIAEDLPYLSIAFRQEGLYVNGRVGGNIVPLESNVFDSIASWYIRETAE